MSKHVSPEEHVQKMFSTCRAMKCASVTIKKLAEFQYEEDKEKREIALSLARLYFNFKHRDIFVDIASLSQSQKNSIFFQLLEERRSNKDKQKTPTETVGAKPEKE